MNDEATQLLRDIRDATLRQESAAKRFRRALVVIIAILLCLVAFLMVRLERLMTEADQGVPTATRDARR